MLKNYEYKLIEETKDDNNTVTAATTLKADELFADSAEDAREEILMHEAELIEQHGGRKKVRILVRPFLED